MNVYAIIILATLLVDFSLNLVADILNLRTLRAELPAAFQDVYDGDAYRKSQAYTRVQTQFGWVTGTFSLLVVLVFWFAGGFAALDHLVRGWVTGPIWSGLLYISLLLFGRALLSMPFSIYSTFVLEARFGFNQTTPWTFVTDMLKGLLLAVVLGGPLLAGILAFFTYAGPYAWLYCWGVTTAFMLAVQYVAPTWIMPLFNTFKPLDLGALKEALFAYAQRVDFPLKDVFVMDGSRRSSKSNAFFTGFGKSKRIALFDTLIDQLTNAELVAVLAHEIGHYKKKHVIKGLLLSIAHMGVMFFLLSIFMTHEGLFLAFAMEQPSIYAGMIFFGLLYTPVELLLSIAMSLFSRRHESEADRFATQTVDSPEALVQGLQKLSLHNLSNLTPHPFYVFLNYSHPPVLERIQAIRRAAVGVAEETA
jgi:STE24 endopeptidase